MPPHRPLSRAVAVAATRLHAPVAWHEVVVALAALAAALWALSR